MFWGPFTRRRSLVRVQQSPPSENPCSSCAARVFLCFGEFLPVRDWRIKSQIVLPDAAEFSLSGCMKLYGFFRCPKGFWRRNPSCGCTLELMCSPRRLSAAGPTAAAAPDPAPGSVSARRSLPPVAPMLRSSPPSPPRTPPAPEPPIHPSAWTHTASTPTGAGGPDPAPGGHAGNSGSW